MATTKEDRLALIHTKALAEFDTIVDAVRDEREQCLQDRRFYSIAGAQWEGNLGEQYENKPKFEVNKIHLSVMRIINEYRNNRISVSFVPKDGTDNDALSDTCNGLYRSDETDSCAEEAQDNAFEEAVGGGMGAWRLRATNEDEYDDDNSQQRIRMEPIYDADSTVFFDLGAKRQDKSDAKHCFVLNSMPIDQYIEEYNDDPDTWSHDITQNEFDWFSEDAVYIAEYYVIETKKESVFTYKSLDGDTTSYTSAEFKADPNMQDTLEATGNKQVNEKKVRRRKVHKYLLSGGKVLEDCGIIAGDNIPIILVYGKRWYVDNIERCMGHVRLAKDVQRLKNMQLSKLGELSAASSYSKPIFTPEQMGGHSTMWEEDNIKNYPFLLLNPIVDADGNTMPAGAIGYTKTPEVPAAMAALFAITEQDMQDLLGNQQAGEELMSNVSGIAYEMVQNKLDMQTFIYMSNMAKAVKRAGEIWLGMARDTMVEDGRKMKVIDAQRSVDSIELMRPVLGEDGEVNLENDMSKANYEVVTDVGPSSSTKRSATVKRLMSMLQLTEDPETKQVLGSSIMMNIEGEGMEDIREYFRTRLVKMGVLEPTEEDIKAAKAVQENAKPDANEEYLMAAAQSEEAKAAKARADTVLTAAKAENTRADTMATLAGISNDERESYLKVAAMLEKNGIRPTV